MSDLSNPADDVDDDLIEARGSEYTLHLPDDLPPVEPPSAGMIIQLFLVPAIIVAVIVGVYAAFGQLASQELDWRQLVTDVQSGNPHVRWRGALGLAQMLDADAQRGENSQDLTASPEIATALAELYTEYLALQNLTEEELKNLEFLSKALGRMRVQEIIIPVFRQGMQPNRDRNVRKHSLIGLSMLAGNAQSANEVLNQPEIVDELIEITSEGDRLLRHQGAYALGLFPSAASQNRLIVLLENPDLMTQVNAAIGLARNDSSAGVPVFFALLKEAEQWELDPSQVQTEEQGSVYFERMLMLTNAVKALTELEDQLDQKQKENLSQQLQRLAQSKKDAVFKSQVLELKEILAKSS